MKKIYATFKYFNALIDFFPSRGVTFKKHIVLQCAGYELTIF